MHTQLAHMPILLFCLHFHLCNSCVCVCKLVHTLPSSSIFIHIYRHIHMYICFHYCVMTPYNLYAPIITVSVHLLLEARCLHTCDPIFKSLYFNIHPCLYFLWMHTYHVRTKKVKFCVYLPLTYVQPCLFPYLFHPSKHVLTCECQQQDRSINKQTKKQTNYKKKYIYIYTNAIKINIKNSIR